MDDLAPSDLKTILHSRRANLYVLEHCRVLVKGGRVEYVTDEGKQSLYWNIPIANTTFILLGTGTSITQPAMRELAKAGVMVGFCGGRGTPLFAGTEVEHPVSWLNSQSEYRPTNYIQLWVSFWFDEEKRLNAAKLFQTIRLEQISRVWTKLSKLDFKLDDSSLHTLLCRSKDNLGRATCTQDLLVREATLTKALYKLAANAALYGSFTRAKRGSGVDVANRFLDQGNYLAYGLAATAAWVLGLPHGLPVLHGKTRRGALVFDIADLVKDAMILPQAFLAASDGDDESQFRHRCIDTLNQWNALDLMIETLEATAKEFGKRE